MENTKRTKSSRVFTPASESSRKFFFQAEVGMRDLTVTGVQTCALPIWHVFAVRDHAGGDGRVERRHLVGTGAFRYLVLVEPAVIVFPDAALLVPATYRHFGPLGEIGRASCRERSVDLGGRRIIKKKNRM